MNKKILLFDYDGVIADTLEIYAELFVDACNAHGYPQINSKEEFLKLFENNLYDSMMSIGINEGEIKKILGYLKVVSMKHQGRIVLFHCMKEVLSVLSQKNKIIIIT